MRLSKAIPQFLRQAGSFRAFQKSNIMIILKPPCMESILFILLALVGLCLGWRLVEWHSLLAMGIPGLVVLSLTAAGSGATFG